MNTYPAKNIINVAMAGHSGAGKTSLAEAMLYLAGASDRRGKVGEGNTVCDSDPEEIRRKTSGRIRCHRACRQERRFRRYGKGFCGSGKARPV